MRGVVYCKHEGEWAGRAGTKYLPSIIVDAKPESTQRMMKLPYIAINKAIASNRTTCRDEKSSGCRKHSIFGQAALPNLIIKISGIVEAETVVEEAMRTLHVTLLQQQEKYLSLADDALQFQMKILVT